MKEQKKPTTLAEWVFYHRDRLGMTQRRLGHVLGIHRDDVSEIEAGRRIVSSSEFMVLCQLFEDKGPTHE